MNKIHKKQKVSSFANLFCGIVFLSAVFCIASNPLKAEAALTPTLTLAYTNADMVQVSVTADPNSVVTLYYHPNYSASALSSTNIGTTNSVGNLNTNLSGNTYNIQSGSAVYVIVNNQQSSTQNWPYYNSNSNSNIYLSQNNITIGAGQSATISINGGNSNGYYISSNSNSNVVSAYVSSNGMINITGNNNGSATLLVCSNSASYGCANLYVTVSGYNGSNSQPVTLGQNNVALNLGQSSNVGIYGGTGIYYISSNANSNIVTTTLNGNSINLYARNPGSDTIVLCSSVMSSGNSYSYSSCANLYVTVGQSYVANSYNYTNTGTSVAGVFLSQIPYTGVGENIKMTLFVLGMIMWSAFMAYIILAKKRMVFATNYFGDVSSTNDRIAEFKRANLARKGK